MMIKSILSSSYDFGEPPLQLVKSGANGLRGEDFRSFVKRAGFAMADVARKVELHPGEELIHGIALGTTEHYGPNRNGDGFKEAACRLYHPTFVKYARWYRHHANKDTKKSYGIIKYSHFNDDMKRIELLAALNRTKEAAERNGGLVADEELEALHDGKDVPTSMACKVAYDVCAGCGHKAKNRTEYCTGNDEGGMCKRGGVKNRMGFVHDDGFMNHVDNPHPHFFDWSKVYRGADRTSFADGILKAAATGGVVIGGAELAEKMGVQLPDIIMDVPAVNLWPTRLEKLATKLAAIEQKFDRGGYQQYDLALSPEFEKEAELDVLPSGPTHLQLAALAMQKIALPVESWFKLVHGDSCKWASADMIRDGLPGIYGRMLADGYIKEASGSLPSIGGMIPHSHCKWAYDLAPELSLDRSHLDIRVKRAAIRGYSVPDVRRAPLVKSAGAAETLARGYALYKLAFLQALEGRDTDFDLTCTMVTRQNYI
jgi:hypothetical protein